MAIRVGNIASGDDFFDRVGELADMWRYLEGNHVSLTGPRRLGKSSLLKRLGEQAEEKGVFAQMVDVEGLDSAAAFIAAINAAYPDECLARHMREAASKFGSLFKVFKKVDLKLPGGLGAGIELQALPQALWVAEAKQLEVRLSAMPVLLLIDEFSVFLEKLILRDKGEAEQLLGWLRRWRMTETACRFVFSGSIGINSLLERHQMSTWLNDCYEYELGPFRPKPAREMLSALAQREAWVLAEPEASYLCDKAGWLSPFYLNLLLDETMKAGRDRLLELGEDQPQVLLAGDVDDGYDRLLASRSRFIHWYKRLQRDLPEPQLSMALNILRHTANASQALSRKQLMARLAKLEVDPDRRAERLSECLAYLQENGYLGQVEAVKVSFLSFLLRDYWRRNHAD